MLNSVQLKLSFLSNVACNKVVHANFPKEDAQTKAPLSEETANTSYIGKARRDGFVSSQVEKTVAEAVSRSVKPATKGINWIMAMALGVLGTGFISAGAIVMPLLSKKAPSPEVVTTVAKGVETTAGQAIDKVVQTAPQIVAAATSQPSHAQSSGKTKGESFFGQAREWIGDRMPFNKQNHTVTPAAGGLPPAPVVQQVVISPVASATTHSGGGATSSYSVTNIIPVATKCKKGRPGYTAYAAYRDSLKPNAQALKSAISTEADDLISKTEPASASRDLYEFHGFLSDLIGHKVKVPTGQYWNKAVPVMKTLKTDDLYTVPVIQQLLFDTQKMLELPTLIEGSELQRAHLKNKIELYSATIDAYLNNGVKPSNWDVLIQPTKLENERDRLDDSRFDDINSILQVGQKGKEINKYLARILDDFMDDLGAVAQGEQTIYLKQVEASFDRRTGDISYNADKCIPTSDCGIVLPWLAWHRRSH